MSQQSVSAFFQARKKTSRPTAKKALFNTEPTKPVRKKEVFEPPLELAKNQSLDKNVEEEKCLAKSILVPATVERFASPIKKELSASAQKCQSPLKRELEKEPSLVATPTKDLPRSLIEDSPSKQAKRDHHSLTPSKLLSPKVPVRSPGHGLSKSAQKPTHKLESSARKALFIEKSTEPLNKPGFPSLTKDGIAFDVNVTKPRCVPPSPVKASPRKKVLEEAEKVVDKAKNLLQPSDILPLPQSYKELTNIFRTVDELITLGHGCHHNYGLKAIQSQAHKALRKPLTDSHLKQIRCVYPKAYLFTWEPKKDSRGQPTHDYELFVYPNFENNKDFKMTPSVRVEREKMFKHFLLTIVQDHHQEFLQSLGIDKLENQNIHRWHKDFDVEEHCPAIEEEEFPAKPLVDSPERNPKAMLEKITGLNASVEKALKKVVEVTTPVKAELSTPVKKVIDSDIQLSPALRDLPPHLLAKIKADERQRRIKEMTMDKSKQKEIESLEELLNKRVRYFNVQSFVISLAVTTMHYQKSKKRVNFRITVNEN